MGIDPTILASIEADRLALDHGDRTAFLAREADRLGVSLGTLYRHLRRYRKAPAKEVVRERGYAREHVEEILRRKVEGMRFGDSDREIPTRVLRQELVDEGVPEAELPSVSRINALLRDEYHLREAKTYAKIEATFAGEQCQLDHSRSKHFQLKGRDEDRDDWLLVVRSETLAYKADNTRLRTWYTNYVDRYSRLYLPRIVPASGESITVGLEHLDHVWNRPPDEHPLQYVPHALQTDRGALGKSEPYRRALEALGVDRVLAQSKEAQGMVENRFRHLWRSFELPLARKFGKGYTIWLSDLNALLFEFAVEEGRRLPHPVERALSREEAFLRSVQLYPPREVDVSVLRVACRVVTRRVDQYGCVSLDNERFAVPQYVAGLGRRRVPTARATVRVWQAESGEVVGELVDEATKPFRLEPWAPTALGDHRRPGTATTRERVDAEITRAEREAKAEARRLERARAAGKATGTTGRITPRADLLDPSSPVTQTDEAGGVRPSARRDDTPAEPVARTLTEHEARVYINARLQPHGRFLADFQAVFAPVLRQRDGISQTDVDALLQGVLARVTRRAS